MDSFLNLSPKELARVAADPGGSRVMDSLIEGPCTAKFKKKLLKKLQGYYATVASTPGGNFLVEKCYTYAVRPLPLPPPGSPIPVPYSATRRYRRILQRHFINDAFWIYAI